MELATIASMTSLTENSDPNADIVSFKALVVNAYSNLSGTLDKKKNSRVDVTNKIDKKCHRSNVTTKVKCAKPAPDTNPINDRENNKRIANTIPVKLEGNKVSPKKESRSHSSNLKQAIEYIAINSASLRNVVKSTSTNRLPLFRIDR